MDNYQRMHHKKMESYYERADEARWQGTPRPRALGAPLLAESDQNARVVTAINRPVTIFALISRSTIIAPKLQASPQFHAHCPEQALSV